MTHQITSIPSFDSTTTVARVVPAHLRTDDAPVLTDAYVEKLDGFDGIPSAPPLEVMAEVAAQFDRLDALRAEHVSLRFDVSESNRVRIEVVGEDGEVRRRIPVTEAMEIAAGERPVLPPSDPRGSDEPFTFDRKA
jgi:hypothetical protein